jgi:hypothetical protein
VNVVSINREFVQIWKGWLTDTGEERWFLDWHLSIGGALTMSDRATEAEIEADAEEYGLPIVRQQPNY